MYNNGSRGEGSPYERLLFALQVTTGVEAASLLGARQSLLSDCKRRGMVVTEKVLEHAEAKGINLEGVLHGPETLPIV